MHHDQKNTYYAAKYRRIASRKGPIKAVVAIVHAILVAIWNMINNNYTYNDLGADYFTRINPERAKNRAVNQLRNIGYKVTLSHLEEAI